jgi:hypothetical protein
MINNTRVLQLLRLPARLTVEETGTLLGFHPDSVRFLVKAGLLKALGENEDVQLICATIHIRKLCADEKWLTKATNAVRLHHKARNSAQRDRRALLTNVAT